MVQSKARNKIIDSLLELAAEKRWEDVTLASIAKRSGMTLAALRAAYDDRIDILADFVRRTDENVLAGIDADMAEEPPRERLFDVLFGRLEALKLHRQALGNIGAAACRDPALALALNRIESRAMAWMLAGAGISAAGPRGAMRAQGLVLVWLKVMRTWLHDDDSGLARTMAELDRRLKQAEWSIVRFEGLCDCVTRIRRGREESREPPRRDADLAEGHPS